jgi:hypothetical protein
MARHSQQIGHALDPREWSHLGGRAQWRHAQRDARQQVLVSDHRQH